MFSGLEEERTWFRKKNKTGTKKKKPHRTQKWVGRDKKALLKHVTVWNITLAVFELDRFLRQTFRAAFGS